MWGSYPSHYATSPISFRLYCNADDTDLPEIIKPYFRLKEFVGAVVGGMGVFVGTMVGVAVGIGVAVATGTPVGVGALKQPTTQRMSPELNSPPDWLRSGQLSEVGRPKQLFANHRES